jgi:hypothetical protein
LVDFAIDYNVLHTARNDLHDLADRTGPTLKNSDFATLGKSRGGDALDVFGDAQLAAAFSTLYHRAKHPMEKAEDDLRKLGDTFGAVADAFFNMDAQIAEGVGVMGTEMGLSDWRAKHDAWMKHDQWVKDNNLWQQYLANKGVCQGDGQLPDYCRATDPGPEPQDPGPAPTDHTITTPDGSTAHTTLTLDDKNNVKTETTTITTSKGQTYSSTTTYKDDGRSYVTDTTFADHSTSHSDVTIAPDGSGTMTVTDSDNNKSDFTRSGPGAQWVQTSGPGMDDGGDDGSDPQYDYVGY